MTHTRVTIEQAIAVIKPLIPEHSGIEIKSFTYPQCLTSQTINECQYFMVYLILPINPKKPMGTNNKFSLSRRVENIDRTIDQWNNTVIDLLQQENDQRSMINRRIRLARQQEWLAGDYSVRIDGKESVKAPLNKGMMGFLF